MRLGAAIAAVTFGCTQVYGIEQTAPALLDHDDDGVADGDDNCVDLPNPAQDNSDGDAAGDACDSCPQTASDDQHDEDGDLIGDACDPCPSVRDFGANMDGDDLGDLCEYGQLFSERLLFESMAAPPAQLVAGTTPWEAVNDELVPSAALPADDHGVSADSIALTDGHWVIDLGTRSLEKWVAGEQFGIALYSTVDQSLWASCRVSCANADECLLASANSTGVVTTSKIVALPRIAMTLYAIPQATSTALVCIARPASAVVGSAQGTDRPPVTASFVGSPNTHLRYAEIAR